MQQLLGKYLALPFEWVRILWLVSALKRKATKKRETIFQRFSYTLPLLIGVWILFDPEARYYPVLGARFLPAPPPYGWLGVALTAAGVAVAFWARWHLGANWSGVV